jgi:hypothetical protein
MKKNQKYIVQCIKSVKARDVGLHDRGTYKVGQYVTYGGWATSDLQKAHIYENNGYLNSFNFDESGDEDIDMREYFKAVPVTLTIVIVDNS